MYAAIIHGVINVIGELPVFITPHMESTLLGPNPTGVIGLMFLIVLAIALFVMLKSKSVLLPLTLSFVDIKYSAVFVCLLATFDLAEISLDEFLNRIKIDSSKYETYICRIDDRMIGFCFYIPYRSNLAYAETVEIGLYIKPEFTGKKYDEEMVKYLEICYQRKSF